MKKIIISKNNSGIRIDKFLAREVFFNGKITRGEIIRQIKNGSISIDGKKIKPSYPLKENDAVEINMLEKKPGLLPNKNVEFEIIFEDENIIAINKPAGLQVHPDGKNKKNTLVNGLLHKFTEIKTVGDAPEIRPGIVHRLDKDTSGIMIVAKNQKTFLELKDKFKNRKIQKTYQAVVCGRMENKKGIIDAPLARSADYKKQVVAGKKTETKIRPAVTQYKTLKNFKEYSLLEAMPKTGRTHQIRVHLFSIGHPIAGDEKYKLKKFPAEKKAGRLMLHSQRIKFELFGKKFEFEAEITENFRAFLSNLDEKTIKG